MGIQGLLRKEWVLAVALGAASWAQPSLAAAPASSNQCFFLQNWTGNWRATPDGRTIYLRLNSDQGYRLDLDGAHPILNHPFAMLLERTTDSVICTPADFRLTATDGTGLVEPIIVHKMTMMTRSQIQALPEKLRP